MAGPARGSVVLAPLARSALRAVGGWRLEMPNHVDLKRHAVSRLPFEILNRDDSRFVVPRAARANSNSNSNSNMNDSNDINSTSKSKYN